ncbi:MAG: flagellar hook-length control protein FliK [Planctomycetota bacterium]
MSAVSPTNNTPARQTPTSAPAPTAKPQQPGAAVDQVARGMTGLLKNGGTMTLKLTPHELGELRVQVELREGVVSARFRAEQASARELLNGHLDTLRSALEARGVRVDRLEVEAFREAPVMASSEEAGRKARFGGVEPRSGGGQGSGDASDDRAGDRSPEDSAEQDASDRSWNGSHGSGQSSGGDPGPDDRAAQGRAAAGAEPVTEGVGVGDAAGYTTERTADIAGGSETPVRIRVDVVG